MANKRTKYQYSVEIENLPDREVLSRALAKIWAETVYVTKVVRRIREDEPVRPNKNEANIHDQDLTNNKEENNVFQIKEE